MSEEVKTNLENEKVSDVKTVKKVEAEVSNCIRLNIRVAPTKASDVVVVVSKGDRVKVNRSEMSSHWAYVELLTGECGYAMTKYLKVV